MPLAATLVTVVLLLVTIGNSHGAQLYLPYCDQSHLVTVLFLCEPPFMTSSLFDPEGRDIMFSEILLIVYTSRGWCTQKILL
jgi:hypothetical protein